MQLPSPAKQLARLYSSLASDRRRNCTRRHRGCNDALLLGSRPFPALANQSHYLVFRLRHHLQVTARSHSVRANHSSPEATPKPFFLQVLYSITKHTMRRSADEIGATSISFRPKVFSDPASVIAVLTSTTKAAPCLRRDPLAQQFLHAATGSLGSAFKFQSVP